MLSVCDESDYAGRDIAWASTFFDVAGISTAGSLHTNYIRSFDCVPKQENTLLGMMSLCYGELQALDWDAEYIMNSFDEYGFWSVEFERENSSFRFIFPDSKQETASAYPSILICEDFLSGGMVIPITDKVTTGMTCRQMAAAAGIPEPLPALNALEAGWCLFWEPEEGCSVCLFFDVNEDTSLITGAEISFVAND